MSQKRALVIGHTGGIGRAMGAALQRADFDVIGLARSSDGLDLTDEQSITSAFAALDGPFDLIFVATGALEIDRQPPEKTIKALDPQAMTQQFALNAIGPALILKHALPLMPKDRRCVFAALSARVGSIGDNRLGGWYSYRAAKAALNQLVHTAAIEVARTHKQAICVALHPGTVLTSLSENYGHPSVTPEAAAQNLLRVMNGLTTAQSGFFFDSAGNPIAW